VESFIDKLALLLKTLLGDGGSFQGKSASEVHAAYRDPDLLDAWEELNKYMRGDTHEGVHHTEQSRFRPQTTADESLRQDYAILEVPFGADIEVVRKSYKSLILRYHPDRFAGDAEKQRIALEITKKINESFERIRARV
jgi:DnaJ-domain-containing protein 1